MPQNTFAGWGLAILGVETAGLPIETMRLLIGLLGARMSFSSRPCPRSRTHSLLRPSTRRLTRPSILHGNPKRGTAADIRSGSVQHWPRVGSASPPKRDPILTPRLATYKGG